jgi:hypothetical protein
MVLVLVYTRLANMGPRLGQAYQMVAPRPHALWMVQRSRVYLGGPS